MDKQMEYFLNSKVLGSLGILTFSVFGVDLKWLNGVIAETLHISPFFTNLYMWMFAGYYILKAYWYWQDKKLDKKERLHKLNDKKK